VGVKSLGAAFVKLLKAFGLTGFAREDPSGLPGGRTGAFDEVVEGMVALLAGAVGA